MKTSDAGDWEVVMENLDDWNAKQKPKFEIARPWILVERAQVDFDRVALSKAGIVVAQEHVSLSSTFCIVFLRELRQAKGSRARASL
jgi:hypothetical protein